MSRFLFVVPPPPERSRPIAAVARELAWRGHQIAWTGTHDLLAPEPASAPPKPGVSLRSPAGLLLLWNDHLLPMARDMLPGVQAAIEGFEPDTLVVQDQAIAGAVAGQLAGLPWATIVPTADGLANPFADLPGIEREVRNRIRRVLREAGLDSRTATRLDPQRSAELVLAFTTEALSGPIDDPTGRYGFVGPHPSPCYPVPFDWTRLDPDRPLVLVATETPPSAGADRFLACAAEALAAFDVQSVIVGPPEPTLRWPCRLIIVPRAPVWALLRRAAVVVCDAAPAITTDTLTHGVPMVVAPMTAEQPLVAEQVVRAGAAIQVPARLHDTSQLKAAIRTALTDPGLRDHAHRIRASFTAAGGVPTAADRLEAFATTPPELPRPAQHRDET